MASDYIKDFLELDRHSPNLTFNSPEKKYELTELPLGIRDFFYFNEENIMFAVCSDMNIASRVRFIYNQCKFTMGKNKWGAYDCWSCFCF